MTKRRYRDGPKTRNELKAELEERSIPIPFSGCLVWTGRLDRVGYSLVAPGHGKSLVPYRGHRLAYELEKGPIPDGMVLDHLCRVRCCVNPDHLEPVTIEENLRRGMAALGPKWGEAGRQFQAVKTHCPRGHPYSEDNLYVSSDGRRRCRVCRHKTSVLFWRAKYGKALNYHSVIELADDGNV